MKVRNFLFSPGMGKWIRAARESLEMSQQAFADSVKENQTFISKIEREDAKLIDVQKWKKMCSFLISKGAKPIADKLNPEKNAIDPKTLKKRLQSVKDSTGTTWEALAKVFGVHSGTITHFMRGETVGVDTLADIKKGLDGLEGLPKKLAKEGHISQPANKDNQTKKPRKKSVIEPAHAPISTRAALLMREIDLVRELRVEVDSKQLGDILNGSTAKFLQPRA